MNMPSPLDLVRELVAARHEMATNKLVLREAQKRYDVSAVRHQGLIEAIEDRADELHDRALIIQTADGPRVVMVLQVPEDDDAGSEAYVEIRVMPVEDLS